MKGSVLILEISITGFVVCSDDSDSEHSHELYITSWDGRPVYTHVHAFAGNTSFDVGHYHHYAGVTEPAPSRIEHVHNYYAETSFNDGHSHTIRGTTGPAIPLPEGGHFYRFEGYTTVNGMTPHSHSYCGNTGNEKVL